MGHWRFLNFGLATFFFSRFFRLLCYYTHEDSSTLNFLFFLFCIYSFLDPTDTTTLIRLIGYQHCSMLHAWQGWWTLWTFNHLMDCLFLSLLSLPYLVCYSRQLIYFIKWTGIRLQQRASILPKRIRFASRRTRCRESWA